MVQFLQPSSRLDLKVVALQHILGLTGSSEGLEVIGLVPEVYLCLSTLLFDNSEATRKDAALSLINLSANGKTASKIMQLEAADKLILNLWRSVKEMRPTTADPASMVLCNLTIDKVNCDRVLSGLKNNGIDIGEIVEAMCKEPQMEVKLHYLGPLLSNLSQLAEVRGLLMAKSGRMFEKLLPFTEYRASSIRRGGAVGAIRNCCFEETFHEKLLVDYNILSRLLLPIAGPSPDDFDDDDMDKLPLDLQYLPETKTIEEDSDIRKLILEAILQLCATQKCRQLIRGQNAYLILRELHKVEKEPSVKLACENVVDILIKKEEEINLDNYKHVEVPEDVQAKFEQGE